MMEYIVSHSTQLTTHLSGVHTKLEVLATYIEGFTRAPTCPIEDMFIRDPPQDGPHDDRSIIGEGGFGEVHRMINRFDNEKVAVKVMNAKKLGRHDISIEEIKREAAILNKLKHQHIARYLLSFVNEPKTLFFLVMEFVDGTPLSALIRGSDPLSVATIEDYLYQITSALAYMHQCRILHRDLKPDNIMVSSQHVIKIIDLGLARIVSSSTTAHTRAGTSIYASREKMLGERYNHGDDMWALGCVLIELMTRETLRFSLWSNESTRSTLLRRCCEVDEALGDIVTGLLTVDMNDRPTSRDTLDKLIRRRLPMTPQVSKTILEMQEQTKSLKSANDSVESARQEIEAGLSEKDADLKGLRTTKEELVQEVENVNRENDFMRAQLEGWV
jgi:serine/threonine protein kinase